MTDSSPSSNGPAPNRHPEEQEEDAEADEAEYFALAEQRVARLSLHTHERDDDHHDAPRQSQRHAGMGSNDAEKMLGGLPRRNPGGNERRHSGDERERQEFASDPAAHLWPSRTAEDEKVPNQKADRE